MHEVLSLLKVLVVYGPTCSYMHAAEQDDQCVVLLRSVLASCCREMGV